MTICSTLSFGDGFGDVSPEKCRVMSAPVWGETLSDWAAEDGGDGRFSRAADMDSGETISHGDRGDDFEVDEGLDAQAADFLQIGVPAMPTHEDAKEQRRDDHLDEAEEDRAEELQS